MRFNDCHGFGWWRATNGSIFDVSGAQIGVYLIVGVELVDFEGIGGLRLVGIDLRLKKTPQEKV